MTGVQLHVLPAGHAFELTGRFPVVVEVPSATEDRGDAE
jgi:hypothetical protein